MNKDVHKLFKNIDVDIDRGGLSINIKPKTIIKAIKHIVSLSDYETCYLLSDTQWGWVKVYVAANLLTIPDDSHLNTIGTATILHLEILLPFLCQASAYYDDNKFEELEDMCGKIPTQEELESAHINFHEQYEVLEVFKEEVIPALLSVDEDNEPTITNKVKAFKINPN